MYKHPGVYIEELPSGVIPIEAASTSVAAFIGPVRRGKINEPKFITGVTQYEKDFGEMNDTAGGIRDFGDKPDYFGHAVHAFFGNGGKKAYIVRVAEENGPDAAKNSEAAIFDPSDPMKRAFYFETKSEGKWGNYLVAKLSEMDAEAPELGFKVEIGVKARGSFEALETFNDLSLVEGSRNDLVSVINDQSALVKVERELIPTNAAKNGGQTNALLSGSLKGVNFSNLDGSILTVNVDGADVQVPFDDKISNIQDAASFIQSTVRSGAGSGRAGFQAQVTKDNRLLLISGSRKKNPPSKVSVAASEGATKLLFDLANSTIVPYPNGGKMKYLKSGSLAGVGFIPLDGENLMVKVDGVGPGVDVVFTPAETTIEEARAFIEKEVRNGATSVSRAGFQVLVTEDESLLLVSGSSDPGSTVEIDENASSAVSLLNLTVAQGLIDTQYSNPGERGAFRSESLAGDDLSTLPTEKLRVKVDGDPNGVLVTFSAGDTDVTAAADRIQTAVQGVGGTEGKVGFQALVTEDDSLLLISGSNGPGSTIIIDETPATQAGIALLKLTGVAPSGPTAFPDGGQRNAIQGVTLTGVGFRSLDGKKLKVKVDDLPTVVEITFTDQQTTIYSVAAFITQTVQAKANNANPEPGLENFQASVTEDKSLKLVSGSRGPGTAVTLEAVNPSAEAFLYLTDATGLEKLSYPPGGESRFMGGDDGDLVLGATNYNDAFKVLKDYRDVSIILLPGVSYDKRDPDPGDPPIVGGLIIDAAITHSEKMKNRVVVVDPPEDSEFISPKSVNDAGLPKSSHAALYYPWVYVPNPHYHPETAANLPSKLLVGASAFAAGIWARIDGTRGVWKAPAGLEARVRGSLGPDKVIGDDIQDNLNDLGINCIRSIIGSQVVWGARMLSTKTQPDFRYVPIRRTSAMIGESLYGALQAVVFEPNKHILWSALRSNIGNFMDGLFRAGAFQGEKASDAYFVRCNLDDTMTQADVDAGIVRVIVGYAALKPAEFVVIQLKQKVGQSTS
ncbi:MAG: hypothetical protein V3R64_08820 [Sphingomonadales bacterium]